MNIFCSPNACPVILNSKCVFYEGANLVYTNIITNDSLETVIEKLDAAVGVSLASVSIGLSMPSAFTVSNSPISIAGTLQVTGAGTIAQYIRGDGSLAIFPSAETTATIQTKRPLKTIEGESLEGTGNISIGNVALIFENNLT